MGERRQQQRLIIEFIFNDFLALHQFGRLAGAIDIAVLIHQVNVGCGIGERRFR
jgi:hypothetical protein